LEEWKNGNKFASLNQECSGNRASTKGDREKKERDREKERERERGRERDRRSPNSI
jgi:hypothetical protein